MDGSTDGGSSEAAALDGEPPDTGVGDALADAGACVPLTHACSHTTPNCCGAAVCDPKGSQCCEMPGGSCDLTLPNPSADCCLGNECDNTGHCVALQCIGPSNESICEVLTGIPCCTPNTTCNNVGAPNSPPIYLCCAIDGTAIGSASTSICCSGATHVGTNGVTCGMM